MAESKPKPVPDPSQESSSRPRNHAVVVGLAVIVGVAAVLRLANLGAAPPGIHVDSAANAWNANCLLHTGVDFRGDSWPLFYSRSFGGNRTVLHTYLTIPFQLVGGMNVWTTRLPNIVGGIAGIVFIFIIASKLFDTATGVAAAVFLALNPWHIFLSRWGHEAGSAPMLILGPIALLALANVPPFCRGDAPCRAGPAFAAGLAAGAACYGYYAVRIFLPAALILCCLVNWRPCRDAIASSKQRKVAFLSGVVGLAIPVLPLVWKHITDPAISQRGKEVILWQSSAGAVANVQAIVSRYFSHFGPDFLFVRGDTFFLHSFPGGVCHWYVLPFLATGLWCIIRELRRSPAARIVGVWLVLYPVADCFTQHESAHALRSIPGMLGILLTAAVGAAWIARRCVQNGRGTVYAASAICAIVMGLSSAHFLQQFLGAGFNQRSDIYHGYNTDLLDACRWLRPYLDECDAVFVTEKGTGTARRNFIITAFGFQYDPKQWLADGKELFEKGQRDIFVARYGKIHFLDGPTIYDTLSDMRSNSSKERVVFVVRPGELQLRKPVHEIRNAEGKPVIWICKGTI